MNRRGNIGFDRRIDLEWLDASAAQAARAPVEEMRSYLWALLNGVVSGDKTNSARGKTITVLNHIWGDVPTFAKGLRSRAVMQLADATPDERLALHWSMMIATYPIFMDVVTTVGRLLSLQGTVSLAQLTRRVVDTWGERSTITRAIQRIIRSMIQWGVLSESESAGSYSIPSRKRTLGHMPTLLLVEALLIASDSHTISLDSLYNHPACFPFVFHVDIANVSGVPYLQLHREATSTIIELRQDAFGGVEHPESSL